MPPAKSATRDRILDAAAAVLRDRGVAGATTREIAAAAGCSEALLYKHFRGKPEIFVAVLSERLPTPAGAGELLGRGTVQANLERITERLLAFYVGSFHMAASILSSPDLLADWRRSMSAEGAGPRVPLVDVERYLDAEVAAGRLGRGTDTAATAALLVGAALQQAFLALFEGRESVPHPRKLARSLVRALALQPGERRQAASRTGG